MLDLRRQKVQIQLTGLGTSEVGVAKFSTGLSIFSIHNPYYTFTTTALVLPKLTFQLPAMEVTNLDPTPFSGYTLADPNFSKPNSVDVILGANIYGQLLKQGLQHLSPSKLVAQDTVLGWIISGPIKVSTSPHAYTVSRTQCHKVQCICDENLQNSFQRFWEMEVTSRQVYAQSRKRNLRTTISTYPQSRP